MYTAKKEDEDIGKKFVEMLERELKPIHEILKTEIRLNDDMDAEYWEEYNNAKECYVRSHLSMVTKIGKKFLITATSQANTRGRHTTNAIAE